MLASSTTFVNIFAIATFFRNVGQFFFTFSILLIIFVNFFVNILQNVVTFFRDVGHFFTFSTGGGVRGTPAGGGCARSGPRGWRDLWRGPPWPAVAELDARDHGARRSRARGARGCRWRA
jgi:hypothetical protein